MLKRAFLGKSAHDHCDHFQIRSSGVNMAMYALWWLNAIIWIYLVMCGWPKCDWTPCGTTLKGQLWEEGSHMQSPHRFGIESGIQAMGRCWNVMQGSFLYTTSVCESLFYITAPSRHFLWPMTLATKWSYTNNMHSKVPFCYIASFTKQLWLFAQNSKA